MEDLDLLTISAIKKAALQGRVAARFHAQLETAVRKQTKDGKPYWEVMLVDAEAKLSLKAWSDSPAFLLCEQISRGELLECTGEFAQNGNFGLESRQWTGRILSDEEKALFLGGPEELRKRQQNDYEYIMERVEAIVDPRLKRLCQLFLGDWGERLRRTAAARNYHHARRGGLVEHVASMLRSADCLTNVYTNLNPDLLASGVLFHDSGKLWENAMPENGFNMPYSERGELLGHISIGIELVNSLWRKLDLTQWAGLEPDSEDVRLHLLHLIASHHGELEFGSPVYPKTPEAFVLHYVDNLDAKMEMLNSAYGSAGALAENIFERVRPLPSNLVRPLRRFEA